MQVAVCQFAAGADVSANTDRCRELISAAGQRGADLAVLPEVAMYFDPKRTVADGAKGQRLDGPFATAIAEAARAAGVAVIVGMVEEGDGARDYNTLLIIGADGELLGHYRKLHLYDAFGFRESDLYLAGEVTEPVVIEVAGMRVGALTCYDLRFPEAFRRVVDAGADLIALPAAWIVGPGKERHWATLLAARAIENTIFVAAAGQTGPYGCGQSAVIDPMGVTIAACAEAPGLALAEAESARIAEVRAVNPSLAGRRFTVVER